MNQKAQLACVLAGPIMVIGWVGALIFLAGFIPPPSPGDSAQEILEQFRDDTDAIRIGLIVSVFASALLIPWSVVVGVQMARIEGRRPVLAITSVLSGVCLCIEFIIPLMIWQTAAYRPTPERIDIVHTLNDMSWLMFVGVVSSACIQMAAWGIAILVDDRPEPLFPRWTGYFSLWAALLLTPAGLIVLFKDGPFTWNGLIGFWIPASTWCIWVLTMTWFLHRAVKGDVGDEVGRPVSAGVVTARA